MTTRAKGPGAGFGWLKYGIVNMFRHPKPVFGGAILLGLVCMIPSVITLPMQWSSMMNHTAPGPAVYAWIMGLSLLGGILILPIYGGYLQLLHAVDRNQPARARDIFSAYRGGQAGALIGFGVAMMLLYAIILAAIMLSTGSGLLHWYMDILTASAGQPMPPPSLPSGIGATLALLSVLMLFMMGAYSIALGQVAITRRGVLSAIGDGFAGALKNLLPLLVFVLSFIGFMIVLFIALAIVAVVFGLLGALLGPKAVMVLIVPLDLAFMVVFLAVMFGVMYALWRDVCGDASSA